MDSDGNLYRYESEEERGLIEHKVGRPIIPVDEEEFKALGRLSSFGRKNRMRNKPCVCGSGRKFKHCCWSKFARPKGSS